MNHGDELKAQSHTSVVADDETPVAIITSKLTASAGEDVVVAFKIAPTAPAGPTLSG